MRLRAIGWPRWVVTEHLGAQLELTTLGLECAAQRSGAVVHRGGHLQTHWKPELHLLHGGHDNRHNEQEAPETQEGHGDDALTRRAVDRAGAVLPSATKARTSRVVVKTSRHDLAGCSHMARPVAASPDRLRCSHGAPLGNPWGRAPGVVVPTPKQGDHHPGCGTRWGRREPLAGNPIRQSAITSSAPDAVNGEPGNSWTGPPAS